MNKTHQEQHKMSSLQLLLDLAEELDNMKIQESKNNNILHRAYPHLYYRYHFAVPSNEKKYPFSSKEDYFNNISSSIGKEGFQVSMDVQQFLPNELTVKTIDNYIVIEGKHQEREDDHGFISRHFIRKYLIPKGYDPTSAISSLSSDGILTVSVPKPILIENKSNERIIQIQHTGPAHLSVKDNIAEEKCENNKKDNKNK